MSRAHATFIAIVLIALASISAAFAADKIKMSADSCFSQMHPNGAYPIRITLQNRGASARGVVRVHPGTDLIESRTYSFPIDLPPGTDKVITAYPVIPNYGSGVTVEFDGPGNVRSVVIPATSGYYGYHQMQVGYIGDDVGCLGALRRTSGDDSGDYDQYKIHYSDCYCTPEDAPDREPGYDSLHVLVLGEGAERLTDAQWSAIEKWTLAGGCVLFVGGAGSGAYMNSQGAAPLSPVSAVTETSTGSLNLTGIYSIAGQSRVGLVSGTPRAGAYTYRDASGQTLFWRQRYGLGTTALLAFNPFVLPVRGTPTVGGLLSAVMLATRVSDAAVSTDDEGNPTSSAFIPSSAPGSAKVNPFKVHLPPTSAVAGILFAYILLAVPVTYFVLRRLGRLEWAWVTTPLLSVLFAFAFYLFTAQLYKAGLSRRTMGILGVAVGRPVGVFTGTSDLFFPQGGGYQLGIDNGWGLENGGSLYGYRGRRGAGDDTSRLETIDTRTGVVAPAYSVTNLAFRRISYGQAFDLNGSISGSLRRQTGPKGRVTYTGTLTNATNLRLTSITAGGYQIGPLAPGETRNVMFALWNGAAETVPAVAPEFRISAPGGPGGPPRGSSAQKPPIPASPDLIKNDHSSLTVRGQTSALPFGPQSGTDVSGEGTATVLIHIPVTEANP